MKHLAKHLAIFPQKWKLKQQEQRLQSVLKANFCKQLSYPTHMIPCFRLMIMQICRGMSLQKFSYVLKKLFDIIFLLRITEQKLFQEYFGNAEFKFNIILWHHYEWKVNFFSLELIKINYVYSFIFLIFIFQYKSYVHP